MTKEHAYAYESGYQDGLTAARREFWHGMADEQPTDERGKYILLGKRGAMYLANGFHTWDHSGRKSFYIPNNRSGYIDFDKVEAWAEVPPCEEADQDG